MIRGFVAGVLWGGLVAGTGLVVVSQVAPPPGGQMHGVEAVEAVAEAAVEPAAGPPPEPAAEPAPGLAVEPGPEASADPAANPTPVAPTDPVPDPAPAAAAEPPAPDAVLSGDSAPVPPPQEAPTVFMLAEAEPAPVAPGSDAALTSDAPAPQLDLPAAEVTPAAPSEPNPLPGAGGDALLEAAPPAAADAAPAPPQPDGATSAPDAPPAPREPAADPTPAADGTVTAPPAKSAEPAPAPEPEPALEPEPAPEPEPALIPRLLIDDQADTLPSAGTFGNRAAGVTTGRLPSIGGPDASPEATEQALSPEDLPPLRRYARLFDGAGGKPLFVILLRDIGAAGMARENLADLPFPVTFVVDPAAPDAAAAVGTYRAAGQEVLMLATGIPAGAQPSDLEQTFQSLAASLPETVGVVDLAEGGFQDNRDLAAQVVPILKEQGRGLVTYDQGLNAADQVARREGVAATTIFRRLDGEGEDTPVVRRYLDRAAFRAAQEGQVVVIGDTRAETVAAILEWTVEGRASAVTLAPVTAVLGGE